MRRRPSMMATTRVTRTATMASDPSRSRCVSLTREFPGRGHTRGAGPSRAPRLPGRPQPIAEAPNRLDQIARGAELRSEPLHVHVDGARLNVGCRFPYGLEQVRARLHPSTTLGERDEQAILGGRKLDVHSIHRNPMRAAIDLERPDTH